MPTIEETYSENKTKGQIVEVLCIECNRKTRHRIAASLDKDGIQYDRTEGWNVEWFDYYQVVQCQGCQTVSFRHLNWFSGACYPDIDEPGTTELLYPKRGTGTLKPKPILNVPTILRRLYGEVIDCFNNDSLTLCAAGLRAMVEGICATQGIVDGPLTVPAKGGGTKVIRQENLEGKIAGMHEKGILTQASTQTLHDHRYLGNEAVHELARPSQDELKLAIEIVEHMLEQIYEIPQKALELKQYIAKRKK